MTGTGSAADFWSGSSYERIAETYAPIHDRVVASLAIEPGTRVLDVACGTGGVALRAARTGAEVVGVDITADQLAKARHAADEEGSRFGSTRATARSCRTATASSTPSLPPSARSSPPTTSAPRPSWPACAAVAARLRTRRAWPQDEWLEVGERAGRPSPVGPDATDWAREDHVSRSARRPRSISSSSRASGASKRIRARTLWELVSTSMPPLRNWLMEQNDEVRARAERVYRGYLAPGVLEREYVLVMGVRR